MKIPDATTETAMEEASTEEGLMFSVKVALIVAFVATLETLDAGDVEYTLGGVVSVLACMVAHELAFWLLCADQFPLASPALTV
jgi:hypothetical protein